ncbi:MAG: elongation factor G [Eubacteriales bacterium]|jgi:elongation factor G
MKHYASNEVRNVVLLGHSGDGKTTLAESLLYYAGNTDRCGKIADGNTVCDYDAEEIKRKISITTALAPVEYQDTKINFIDTPGFFDFVGEAKGALSVADGSVIVVSAKDGVQVGTEKAWKYATQKGLPKIFFINKVDDEHADYYRVVEELRDKFGMSVCPFAIPIIEGRTTTGLVNCASMTARAFRDGKVVDIDMPTDMDNKINPVREMLLESVAETSEELLDKYFNGEPFTEDEIKTALKAGVKRGAIVPVVCGCATTGLGVATLLYSILKYYPACDETTLIKGFNDIGEIMNVPVGPDEPTSLFVFKTVADQFVGKMSFFKVMTGTLKSDSVLINSNTQQAEKLGHIYVLRGKKQMEVKELCTGDIGVVTKLVNTNTGDTLCSGGKMVHFAQIDFPKPVISYAITPKAKGDEEKIASGLSRLAEEDPTISFSMDPETKELIVSGQGDIHIDVITSKLKSKFGVEVTLSAPKVAYRETIRGKAKVEGKHKKQSGGHGQYGHVWIEFEPGDQEEMIFEEKVFGGAVPKNYFPAVEKGLRECVKKGVLAGYPVVNLKATLLDGSYHPVDSSEMAFKTAASLAYKAGLPQAKPVLLEPIGKLTVHVPEENMGDIIGDINKRRGQMLGMGTDDEGTSVVEALVPVAEMATYAIELRSIARGRGSFEFTFDSYQEAPSNVVAKVVEEYKASQNG